MGVCHTGLHGGGGKPETNLREEATLQDALALICPSLQLEVLVLEIQLPSNRKILG